MSADPGTAADPRTRLVVAMAAGVCSIAPNPAAAVAALAQNRTEAERAGLGDAPEAGMNRVMELLASWLAGKLENIDRLARDTLTREPLDWITELLALAFGCLPDLVRARAAALSDRLERVRALCETLPSSFGVDIARYSVEASALHAKGRFAEAAAAAQRGFAVVDRPGLRGGAVWAAFAEGPLMTAVGLASRSGLAHPDGRRAVATARRLSACPIPAIQASARASLAALLWLSGARERGRIEAERAVALCPADDPWRRWRSLTVATRFVEASHGAWATERDALEAAHSFRAPELEW